MKNIGFPLVVSIILAIWGFIFTVVAYRRYKDRRPRDRRRGELKAEIESFNTFASSASSPYIWNSDSVGRSVGILYGRRSPELNRSHPLARGLIGYQLFNKHVEATDLHSNPIFCFNRQLTEKEVEILVRDPYCMFNSQYVRSSSCTDDLFPVLTPTMVEQMEKEEELKEYGLLGRKLRMPR